MRAFDSHPIIRNLWLRVLTIFEAPSVELFEADFPFRFPHAV
jgi:hypothetical protein